MPISLLFPFHSHSDKRLGANLRIPAVKLVSARRILLAATTLLATYTFADVPFSQIEDPGPQIMNWATSELGAKFKNTSGLPVTITQLGRWVLPGNKQEHTIRIYDPEGAVLGLVTVNLSGAAENQFLFGKLPTPVVVPPDGAVFILSTETSGGDAVHGSNGMITRGGDIGTIEAASKDPGKAMTAFGNSWASYSFGPVTFKYSTPTRTWTKSGNTYRTDGSYYQLTSALKAAAPGDTVLVPAGTYTWGANGQTMTVKDGVTLSGEAPGTIINMAAASPTGYGSSLIVLGEGSTIRAMTFNGPDALNCPLIRTGANDWRVSEIVYNQFAGRASYFVNVQGSVRGLIDKCVITGGAGNSELVFVRGPADAWDTAHTIGGANNIFIEDCRWEGQGYVCDANSAARVVVRNNTINGGIKVDGHGVWSNASPQRGVRHMEVYGNTWNVATGNYAAIELRGGGGRVFNNTSTASTKTITTGFTLTEYGVFNNSGAFTDYQTPANYPIRDQIGRGRYAVAGDPSSATSEPMYLWGNRKGGSDWPWYDKTISAASIARYAQQTGISTATFTWNDIIQSDRDYFKEVSSFNGSTGVGIGTKAKMLATKGTKVGVGFWVTDEGDWNVANGATKDGQLYIWNGTSWVLSYTPYTYPHPLRRPPAPAPASLRKG